MKTEVTRFGFVYGPATVERQCDDKRLGCIIVIMGKRESMEIRVTPGGRVLVYSHEKVRK